MNNKIRAIGALCLAVIWLGLSLFAWFSPADEYSLSERRYLSQFPDASVKNVLSGHFMTNFEDYATDQFPLREEFRQTKALFHQYVLGQSDNNDLYLLDGYLAKLEYPTQEDQVLYATGKFNTIYDTMLKDSGCNIYVAVIPDKSYYLTQNTPYLSMDHNAIMDHVQTQMPYAQYIDLTADLSLESYYRTDTHWRQETLVPVAQTICNAMGMPAPTQEEFTVTKVQEPFYGVYHGQAALPLDPDTMYLMESDRLRQCIVGIHDGKQYVRTSYSGVYDLACLQGNDPYQAYLSGTQSLIKIVNPTATSDRTLVVFRDSFGSSLIPLLVSEYKTVIIFDIRELESRRVTSYISFHDKQDVLFLYSTLVLNNGKSIK